MQLRLKFEFKESPLKVQIDGFWEPINRVRDLDLSKMFPDPEIAKLASAQLCRLPQDQWIVCPYFRSEIGFTQPLTILPQLELTISTLDELTRLDDAFQSTFCEDYPPDSGFQSSAEENSFWQAAYAVSEKIALAIPITWQFEFRSN